MAELLTDNIKINSLTFGSYNGMKEASKYWDELFEAFPDIKINPVTITTDNRKNRVLTEMDISGTQKGKVGQLDLVRNFGLEGYSCMILWDTRLRKSECIMTQYSKKTTEYIENIVREVRTTQTIQYWP